jgi:D-alanyl-D-alanine carboxypeptidase
LTGGALESHHSEYLYCMNRIIIIFLLVFSFAASAQTINTARLDTFFNRLDAHNKGMGSIAIRKAGKIIYQHATGYSDVAAAGVSSLANADTRYRIGSITKTFTSTLVFLQVEQGKLTLDQTLDRFFPDLPNASKITIRDMLVHRSGLHNITEDSTYDQWNTTVQSNEQILARIVKNGIDFDPGAKSVYSNTNFILLGMIVEKITGKDYATLIREQIAGPLKLSNTYVFGSRQPSEARSYRYTGQGWQLENDTDPSIPRGAGAIVSTPTDLTAFFEALFMGRIVNASSLEEMKKTEGRYGKGLMQIPFGDKQSFGHTGSIDAFHSVAAYFPSDSITIAYCNNGENYKSNNVLIATLSITFNKPFDIPSFEVKKVDEAILTTYTGTYAAPDFPLQIEVRVKMANLKHRLRGRVPFRSKPMEPTASASMQQE